MSSEEFCICHELLKQMDLNDCCMWEVSRNMLFIKYFNEQKVNLSEMHEYLNHKAVDFELQKKGWKLLFQMRIIRAEPWNSAYLRKLEFILYRLQDDVFLSKFKIKEIKKMSPLREKYLLLSNILILYNFFKKTVAWSCDNFEKDNDIVNFFYVESGE